nr:hypothetical protein [Tanacetum cinerariifolium]
MKKVDRGITMINQTQVEAMGILTNVLCQVGVTTLIAKFLIFAILIDRDSPIVVGRGFLRTIDGIINTPERLFSTFDGFCHQTFRAARSGVMRNAENNSDDEEDYHIKRNNPKSTLVLPQNRRIFPCFPGSTPHFREEHTTEKPNRHDPKTQDNMKPWKRYCFHKFITNFCYGKDVTEMQSLEIDDMLRIRLRESGKNEEIFTSVAWIRASNINELIYAELCHEFYSTYEFDEACANDELQTKKIIRFRLGGRAHNFTVCSKFVSKNDSYDKIQKNDIWLLSMFDARHRHGYVNVAWVIARWMKKKGAGTQRESQICCVQFISKLARKYNVLTEDMVRSLSALIYCRDLDTTTLRDLIDSDGKLIPDDPQLDGDTPGGNRADRVYTVISLGQKINKSKKTGAEGMCSKEKKVIVTIYKSDMVNGKAKMVEDIGAVETKRHRGVVIRDDGFNNVGGKEEVVSKRGVGSRKMEGTRKGGV